MGEACWGVSQAPIHAFFGGVEWIVNGEPQMRNELSHEGLLVGGHGQVATSAFVEWVATKIAEHVAAELVEHGKGHLFFHLDESAGIGDGAVLSVETTGRVTIGRALGVCGEVGIDKGHKRFAVGQQPHGYLAQAGVFPRTISVRAHMEAVGHFRETLYFCHV